MSLEVELLGAELLDAELLDELVDVLGVADILLDPVVDGAETSGESLLHPATAPTSKVAAAMVSVPLLRVIPMPRP